ncbi:MAG: ChbG/HpnK family deacetylase [Ignavibacteriaceae bacterium]|nr:ChbG/HpnK family deacetylase [Ignavibacteriaceae bacterium]
MIRCDDMGMCHSLNAAMEKVIETGLPISTSVMFACPWYLEAVEILKKHPDVSVGIHLTLNAEWKNYRWGPILGREAVPSLVDSNGFFFPSRVKLFANNPKTDEIERELRAQIVRGVNSGIQIDYLDYHMGAAVQTKELRKLVENLAKEYGLGMSGYFNESYSSITYSAPLGEKTDSLLTHVKNLKPGINLQVVHVGLQNLEMNALLDLNSSGLPNMSKNREEELESLLTPELPGILREKNIKPITYRELIGKLGLGNMFRAEDSEY